jgi:stage III sporulation protein SpoIIIAA
LADEMQKRVIIIDTSNEIAGDSDIPHPGIGRARRMQVAKTEFQHQIMIEAVENHMPQVIIVDEIGTELEVLAARTIAEKGVQLVGTTHGNCLENLIKNPTLVDLIGGIQYVTLSDDEAKKRRTQKSILERKAYPAFEIIIEINHQNSWTIHENVQKSVDLFLRGNFTIGQIRQFYLTEKIKIKCHKTQNYQNSLLKHSSKFK